MPLSTDQNSPGQAVAARRAGDACKIWIPKLHYFLGLYLLFFVWLFAFTGLLLNRPNWKFAEFWENRRQATYEREITPPTAGGDLAQARDLMRQLGLRGEIEWTATRDDATRFEFRVSRPGHILEIKANLLQKKASIHQIDLNGWGVIRILHTFTGVRMDDSRNGRDWVLTSAWALAMDAVAVGLILMVLSSFYMWYQLRRKRLLGIIVLGLGFAACGLFCFGLRWIY